MQSTKSNHTKFTLFIFHLFILIFVAACSNGSALIMPTEPAPENPLVVSTDSDVSASSEEVESMPSTFTPEPSAEATTEPTKTTVPTATATVAETTVAEVAPEEPAVAPTSFPIEENEANAESRASEVAASPAAIPLSDSFVRRDGTELYLNGELFRFVGTNAFFLQPEIAYSNEQGVVETLDKAVAAGFNVIRMWGFNDKDPAVDPAAIQLEPGIYNEESLRALDRVIALAKERNLKLILPLVNNWQDYGGIPRYLEWCKCEAEHGDFYTNERMKEWYRSYVEMVLTRVNTETGIAYRDEPTILAWELGNELRNRGQDATTLLAWHQEMATFIKQVDPNHLIADGGEGFDDNPSLYAGLTNTYPVRGSEGTSYHQIALIPEIDLLSYHLYPEHWGIDAAIDGPIWIRTHEAIARAVNKVAYLGEFGLTGADAERAALFQSWLDIALVEENSSGVLVWGLVYDARPNSDGFNIYCPADVETCAVLQQ